MVCGVELKEMETATRFLISVQMTPMLLTRPLDFLADAGRYLNVAIA